MRFTTLRILAAALGIIAAVGWTPAMAQDAKPQNLKFASFNIGGSWYIYAQVISKLSEKVLPQGSTMEVLPYQGGNGNPILVHRGEADLGLTFSAVSNWAYNKKVSFDQSYTNIRGLVGGLGSPYRLTIMTRPGLGIESLGEIKAQKKKVDIVTVQIGGSGESLTSMALESYGMTYDDIKSWGGTVSHLDLAVAIERLRNGQVDMLIHNVGFRQPNFVELDQSTDLKFIGLGEEQMKSLVEKYGLEADLSIKAGEFRGVKQDIPSVGYTTVIIVSKDVPEETAYTITKAICENQPALEAAHASLKDFDPAKAYLPGKNGNIPLHPGAIRYYKEKGLM